MNAGNRWVGCLYVRMKKQFWVGILFLKKIY